MDTQGYVVLPEHQSRGDAAVAKIEDRSVTEDWVEMTLMFSMMSMTAIVACLNEEVWSIMILASRA